MVLALAAVDRGVASEKFRYECCVKPSMRPFEAF